MTEKKGQSNAHKKRGQEEGGSTHVQKVRSKISINKPWTGEEKSGTEGMAEGMKKLHEGRWYFFRREVAP